MSIVGQAVGAGVGEVVSAVGGIIDDLFTSDDERMGKQALLERIRQNPAMAQARINEIEAGNRNLFVAGWRPFIGWTCGVSIAYKFVATPFIGLLFVVFGKDPALIPEIDTATLFPLVTAMLGLAVNRTYEKVKGKAK